MHCISDKKMLALKNIVLRTLILCAGLVVVVVVRGLILTNRGCYADSTHKLPQQKLCSWLIFEEVNEHYNRILHNNCIFHKGCFVRCCKIAKFSLRLA